MNASEQLRLWLFLSYVKVVSQKSLGAGGGMAAKWSERRRTVGDSSSPFAGYCFVETHAGDAADACDGRDACDDGEWKSSRLLDDGSQSL